MRACVVFCRSRASGMGANAFDRKSTFWGVLKTSARSCQPPLRALTAWTRHDSRSFNPRTGGPQCNELSESNRARRETGRGHAPARDVTSGGKGLRAADTIRRWGHSAQTPRWTAGAAPNERAVHGGRTGHQPKNWKGHLATAHDHTGAVAKDPTASWQDGAPTPKLGGASRPPAVRWTETECPASLVNMTERNRPTAFTCVTTRRKPSVQR